MTVTASVRKAGPYAGNGVTTSFAFGFKVFARSDVAVIYTDLNGTASTLVLDSDYSVLLNLDQDANPGGTVTYPAVVGPAVLPAGTTLTMIGGLAYDQQTDITNSGRYLPQVVENAFDKCTILIQQLKEISSRTLQAAVGTTVGLIFPAPSSGKFIRWRSDLLGLENVDAGTDSTVLQGLLGDAAVNVRGAGMIGYGAGLAYPASTVGAALGLVPRQIATIALLKGLLKTGTGLALVTGYYAAGDGGGGIYRYDSTDTTSADNAGTLIVATDGGRWKLQLTGAVSVKQFGAKGDGATDDTAAIQAATTWASGLGKTVYFPASSYIYSGITIAATKSVQFIGESTSNTFLLLSSGTATGFTCSTNLPVIFENLTLGYKSGVTGTAGAFIAIPAGGDTNYGSRFRNLQMNAPWVGITTSNAASWIADRVSIGGVLSVGIHVQNTAHPDNGDSVITNCVMTTASSTAINILQRSSGGLRIVNNKMIGGAYYYQMILDNGVNTSDLIVVGNSMEGAATSGLEFRRGGASGTFSNITITGNQFAGGPNVINFDDNNPGWLGVIAISANSITVQGGAGVTVGAANNFTITGNVIRGVLGTEVGIQIAAPATSGMIAANVLQGTAALAINNLSTTTSVIKRVLQGTVSPIVCSTAAGSIFKGSLFVAFPAGFFGSIPQVFCTVNGGSNGIGAGAYSAGTAGVTIEAIAANTGANVSVGWHAEADF